LNSLWGKLCQRAAPTDVRYTRTAEEFHRLIGDPRYDVLDWVHISEQMDRVVVRMKPELCKGPATNNLPVAIFVTSLARLHLYSFMEMVAADPLCRILYVDTDSIYYARKQGAVGVPEGNRLGQMQREMVGRRNVEFVSAGSKNYAGLHCKAGLVGPPSEADLEAFVKIRGFELNFTAAEKLNFDTIRRIVHGTFEITENMYDFFENKYGCYCAQI
jgi:hypothetical protein